MSSPAFIIGQLQSNLRFKLAYISVYHDYQQTVSEAEVKDLLGVLIEDEYEAIESLARRIRQLGGLVPFEEPPDAIKQDLRTKANAQPTTMTKLRFLQRGMTRALEWYDEQITAFADDVQTADLLRQLREAKSHHLQRVEAMIAGLGG
ncbi:MAG: hypothetical protein H5T62_16675 [Anaerolineae bacterium]|nr:hypothetical protein [Anaerolineae bacterium]